MLLYKYILNAGPRTARAVSALTVQCKGQQFDPHCLVS